MKFLIDVNASGALARWLQSMGHDVSSVADQDPRMSDDAILEWATHEKRIIVTTNPRHPCPIPYNSLYKACQYVLCSANQCA